MDDSGPFGDEVPAETNGLGDEVHAWLVLDWDVLVREVWCGAVGGIIMILCGELFGAVACLLEVVASA